MHQNVLSPFLFEEQGIRYAIASDTPAKDWSLPSEIGLLLKTIAELAMSSPAR
jgi:hypothetical protein